MASSDRMLGDLFPETDSRFRTERKGNPMEKAFAVGRGELTEEEMDELVTKAGVDKEFYSLPETKKQTVGEGMFNLWAINRLGGSIEEQDLEVVGYDQGMRKIVEQDLDSIRMQFHGGVNQWFPDTVRSLVLLAGEKEADRQARLKGEVIGIPEAYLSKLRYNGEDYKPRMTAENDLNIREKVMSYLNGKRMDDVKSMEGRIGKVSEIASALVTS